MPSGKKGPRFGHGIKFRETKQRKTNTPPAPVLKKKNKSQTAKEKGQRKSEKSTAPLKNTRKKRNGYSHVYNHLGQHSNDLIRVSERSLDLAETSHDDHEPDFGRPYQSGGS
jgi:hypothetical protein